MEPESTELTAYSFSDIDQAICNRLSHIHSEWSEVVVMIKAAGEMIINKRLSLGKSGYDEWVRTLSDKQRARAKFYEKHKDNSGRQLLLSIGIEEPEQRKAEVTARDPLVQAVERLQSLVIRLPMSPARKRALSKLIELPQVRDLLCIPNNRSGPEPSRVFTRTGKTELS